MKRGITYVMCLLLIVGACFGMTGCKEYPYGAVLYRNHVGYEISDSWIDQYRIGGCRYPNPDYDPADDKSQEMIQDTTSPERRICVIQDEEMLEQVFETFPSVDMQEKTVVLYRYWCMFNTKRYQLEDVQLSTDGVLYIEVGYQPARGSSSFSGPIEHGYVIVLDKVVCERVEINEYRKDMWF